MSENLEIGNLGEDSACEYLSKNGYTILERNWHAGSLEIDIIALKKDILAIVEVKTRSANFMVSPQSAVTKSKQRNLVKATEIYVEKKCRTEEIRFDIISVIINQGIVTNIEHIESAFYPTLR
ncbi:MAG: YraN family protein [Bacteroidales bacterium]|nr:YraN family protein [Bacteroidales bacterium]